MRRRVASLALLTVLVGAPLLVPRASAQSAGRLIGRAIDTTGGVLPGVAVELRPSTGPTLVELTDATGHYRFDALAPGVYRASFRLPNFGAVIRPAVEIRAGVESRVDVVMSLALSADVVVTGKATFTNLADVQDPTGSLLGVADAASQGAITAKQLDSRPLMRVGEVLETVPGLVISQHSGEGKANQYYLRGFNLDHGTDFATTVAGMPVNMPTHAHGQGYSDLNFLIPELVSGVQFRKGPYLAEDGDFSSAGSASMSYVDRLAHPLLRVSSGQDGWGRLVAAASPVMGSGRLLAAVELGHNDGPWVEPDGFRKVNGLLRYSLGGTVDGLALTGQAYAGRWTSTDQVPDRAISQGLIPRFGTLDSSDGGSSSRYSASVEWQRVRANGALKVNAFVIDSRLDLFSNFTYALDDPDHGDQFEQFDRRIVSGGRATYRRLGQWAGRAVENVAGLQVRNDHIGLVGLYHSEARTRLETIREDRVEETSAAAYVQNGVQWTGWLRSVAGLRADGYRFDVRSDTAANSGIARSGIVSPKAALVVGPWFKTEFYANAGGGHHSNDARGATITVDPKTGEPASRVTPLVRARGVEVGLRSVAVPHWQTTFAVWRLDLASELVFAGDAGTTEAGRPSRRTGLEWANYYSPWPWMTCDVDVSLSSARFTDADPAGPFVPGALDRVVSAGVTVEGVRGLFGSIRVRYFGPRPLVEDGSVYSRGSTTVNADVGRQLSPRTRIVVDAFNIFDAAVSDIDYYYASRLPSEPAIGVQDVHTHPALPRSVRVALVLAF